MGKTMDKHLFTVERLEKFVESVLIGQGVATDHARICSQRMIEADLRGMHGHGIFRLPPYCQRLEAGGYNLNPDIRIKRETPVSAVVDGDNGLGQVVVTRAVALSIQKAKTSGMAWVGICNSNHAGAGGVYAAMALPHDLIAMYMAIGNANHMPPWGGVDLLLSTNPIAFAIPTGKEPPIVLDMATTNASYGKVKVAAQKGQELPLGWMVDKKGQALTDPKRIKDGFLLPIGEYKGYGLNFVIGALAGVLNTAAFGSAVIDFNKDFKSPTNSGQLIFTMRPDLFRELAEFKAEMDMRIQEIRNATPMEGAEPIRLPGEMALERQRQMRSHGVPIARPVLMQLREIAHRLDLPDRLDDAH
jgi:LDH2 family malate/lactate/ureidoglycolate dehydrogenase